jgi:capsular polysaccharide transport system permease protein
MEVNKIKKRKPFIVFVSVVRALFLREIEMRISSGRSGLFWTFFEPFLQIFIFVSIRIAIIERQGGSAHASNFDYAVFMASGFIAFNMFRHILSSSVGAFNANRGLFSYKQVKPIDTVIARTLLEMFLSAVILTIFLAIGLFFHFDNTVPKNIPMVALGFAWLALFGFSVGLLAAVGNVFFISVGKFISVISFALLIFSAVFFPLISIPPAARELLLYNPLVHFMEMIHGYWIDELDDRFVDYRYIALWTITTLFLGLWFYRKLEKRIISS